MFSVTFLHKKLFRCFINNTDFSARHQITPVRTGPVHKISNPFFCLILHLGTKECFKAGIINLKSDFTEQASMGITEKESLEGKALQAFQEKNYSS